MTEPTKQEIAELNDRQRDTIIALRKEIREQNNENDKMRKLIVKIQLEQIT